MSPRRILWLDLLRTCAIALMVVYHAGYDLHVFYGWDIPVFEGGWMILARSAASLFLLLVGMSFVLSWQRGQVRFSVNTDRMEATKTEPVPKYLLRGLKILALGLLLSLGSYLFDPVTFIRFGILHCIGISTMLLPLLTPLRERVIVLGIGVIILGWMLGSIRGSSELFLLLNILPTGFRSIDYYPLLPWGGMILIGMGVGWMVGDRLGFSPHPRRGAAGFMEKPNLSSLRLLSLPGRYSLWVYFVHQPLLLAAMGIILGWPQ